MSDSGNKANNRPKARGSRTAPVIELSASEVLQAETATAATPDPSVSAKVIKPQNIDPVQPETVKAETSPVDSIPENPSRPSLFAPMAIAALIGGALGTMGGSVLPGFYGIGASVPNPEVQHLKQQISALAAKPVLTSPEVDVLRQRIQALEGDITKRLGEAEGKLSGRIQGLEGTMKDLASRPGGSAAPAVDLSPLTQRLGTLERDIKTIESKTDAGLKAADPKIAAIAQQVEQATRRMTASNSAPFFASVQGLSQAFNAGIPFATELTAVELLGGKPEDIAPLRALAEKGAPTLAQINARFAPFAGKLAQSDTKSESWTLSILEKFAKVRPVGQVGGSTPADIVSTIEASLGKGDLASALVAWRKLPEPARLASSEWSISVEARDKAAKVISGMQEAAISALRMAKP
jgi:hypothetical protein